MLGSTRRIKNLEVFDERFSPHSESGQVQAKVRMVVADFATTSVQTAFTTAVKTGSVGTLTVDPNSVVVEKDGKGTCLY